MFFEDSTVICVVPYVILGDFNARVSQDTVALKGVLGQHGIQNYNDNGHFLLELCAWQQLSITNTLFNQK